jgi:hypothetical protein
MALKCEVCGAAGTVRVTEAHGGSTTERSFCENHAPPELSNARLPEVTSDPWVEEHLDTLRQFAADPLRKAECERIIAYFEAEMRTMGIPD